MNHGYRDALSQTLQSLAEWLLEAQLVTEKQLEDVQSDQPLSGHLLAVTLVERELVDEARLVEVISERLSIPPAPHRLYKTSISAKVLSTVPVLALFRWLQRHVVPSDARVGIR